MNCNLAVIKGDGIGPEIVTEAMRVLDAVGEKYGHTFSYTQILMGGASIDVHGEPLTEEALEIAKKSASATVPILVVCPARYAIASTSDVLPQPLWPKSTTFRIFSVV